MGNLWKTLSRDTPARLRTPAEASCQVHRALSGWLTWSSGESTLCFRSSLSWCVLEQCSPGGSSMFVRLLLGSPRVNFMGAICPSGARPSQVLPWHLSSHDPGAP